MSSSAAKIERYEKALREIGLPKHLPEHFDALEWWRHMACVRGEIARDALGVTAEELMPANESSAAHVYCGCSLSTGMFDDSECGWEGDVPTSEHPDDRPLDTFDCPECGAEGLLVTQHVV